MVPTLAGGDARRADVSVGLVRLALTTSWFNGPPYALGETVFDEYDFPACRAVAEEDVRGWKPRDMEG